MGIVYRSRNLARDVSRCKGTNCNTKRSCARFKQLERDKDLDYNPWEWVPVTDTLKHSDECHLRIEEVD